MEREDILRVEQAFKQAMETSKFIPGTQEYLLCQGHFFNGAMTVTLDPVPFWQLCIATNKSIVEQRSKNEIKHDA